MNRRLLAGILTAALLALAFRVPNLGLRPMHNDEGVNAIKFRALWEHGEYKYDPDEYHGPALIYLTLAWSKLTGAPAFVNFDEARLRIVTVLAGVGLILLLPLVADGLGRNGTICAGLLTAISPAMVFYSRYYIHELLLVFFTFLALAAGWRFSLSRRIGWALLTGIAVGLMQATKETFVLALAAMAGALILNALWGRWNVSAPSPRDQARLLTSSPTAATTPSSPSPRDEGAGRGPGRGAALYRLFGSLHCNLKVLVATFAAWLLVVVLLFSSFFTNAHGPLDAVRTYLPWLHRAGGASPHIHPWYYYLQHLAFFHVHKGPYWSEGLILALAVVGAVAAFKRIGCTHPGTATEPKSSPSPPTKEGERAPLPNPLPTPSSWGEGTWPDANPDFIRFIAFYTLILTILYSAISYKTPWCLTNFLHGMILLAGVGAAVLWHWAARPGQKVTVAILLIAATGELAFQAWQASFIYPADRANPYTYSQTSPDLLNLVAKLDALAKVDPRHQHLLVKVMSPGDNYWPLPWYLRGFDNVGWWPGLPADTDPYAPVMIVAAKMDAKLDDKKTHVMVGNFELRPEVFLELYVQLDLWKAYLATKPRPPEE